MKPISFPEFNNTIPLLSEVDWQLAEIRPLVQEKQNILKELTLLNEAMGEQSAEYEKCLSSLFVLMSERAFFRELANIDELSRRIDGEVASLAPPQAAK